MQKNIEAAWQQFLTAHPKRKEAKFGTTWSFGNTPEMADNLAKLVLNGQKTATASAVLEYELENEALPIIDPNRYDILLDGRNQPVAIVQTTRLYQVPFNQVSVEHAYKEGEGDRSLVYWQKEHARFWREVFTEWNVSVEIETLDVLCEEFTVIERIK